MIVPRWRTLTITTAILPIEADRLRELSKGKKVLEIGAAHGYSAIIMALAGARHVTSIDPHWDTWLGHTLESMVNNLEAFGVTDQVTIMQQTSIDGMSALIQLGEYYDFIFLDGSAIESENLDDIRLSRKLLLSGGTLARHDYGHEDYPDMKKLLDQEFPEGPHKLTNSLFEVQL